MSLAKVYSRASVGIDAPQVTVEVHLSPGLPKFSIVGLPETAVKESKDRVRSAILNSHFEFPFQRLTVNLAPADLPKEGGRFDLPIALGILAATGQISQESFEHYEFAGELTLSGELHAIPAALTLAIGCSKTSRQLILPKENQEEAARVSACRVLPAAHLLEVCAHLEGKTILIPYAAQPLPNPAPSVDFSEVKGQAQAKRALLIAAAGSHNLLMFGPPGSGKTMLASRLPTILPSLTEEEALALAAIRSISGKKFEPHTWLNRPFRNPHHTASNVALVGGGGTPKPGEVSLAHHGVLFLDELPEFHRHALEALREPMESGLVTISRAMRQCEFPARFQLIAAMNPCPCGHLGSKMQVCQCTSEQIQRYRHKLSGPLLDRIDLHLQVQALAQNTFTHAAPEESSEALKARVVASRQRQHARQSMANAFLSTSELKKHCALSEKNLQLLEEGIQRLKLSARSTDKILKVARTIADLSESSEITAEHLLEAFSYRMFDRGA